MLLEPCHIDGMSHHTVKGIVLYALLEILCS
jgi:hypothetical protein